MGFKMMVSGTGGVGDSIREWLTEKLGNPIMPSKEKSAIKELEDEEKSLDLRPEKKNVSPDKPKSAGFRSMMRS